MKSQRPTSRQGYGFLVSQEATLPHVRQADFTGVHVGMMQGENYGEISHVNDEHLYGVCRPSAWLVQLA